MKNPENNPRGSFAQEVMVISGASLVGELLLGAVASFAIGQEKLDQMPFLQTSYVWMIAGTVAVAAGSTHKYLMSQVPIEMNDSAQFSDNSTSETE